MNRLPKEKQIIFENIMRRVSKTVKEALNEAEKKSDEQKAAEAKLSQEEKVDLWIEGEREINLEACGPDKLRKYYQICIDKDFTRGISEIEKVAKSRNIKLDSEVSESLHFRRPAVRRPARELGRRTRRF